MVLILQYDGTEWSWFFITTVLIGPDFAVRAAPHEGRPVLGKEGEEQHGCKEVSGRKEDEGEPDRDEGKVPGGSGKILNK